jgi:Xaa-Pro aminopeptidase
MDALMPSVRRKRLERDFLDENAVVLVGAGRPLPIAGTDQVHDFHAHPEFYYLTGLRTPGAVAAFDAREGWRIFAPQPGQEDRVWLGDGTTLAEQSETSGLPVSDLDGLARFLEERRGAVLAVLGNDDVVHHPGAYGLSNWGTLETIEDRDISARLSERISEARRAKDADELALMRQAAAASVAGHIAGLRLARAGQSERQLQIEIESEFFRAGGDRTAYGSIVGGGPNGSVLHFTPTARTFNDGEIILVDAGAEVDGYASDVTRTYPVGPRFEGMQRDLYHLVWEVQRTAIQSVRPGVEYRDLHLAACRQVAEGLVDLDILRGDPDALVDADAHAVFFPHGLGHMLGLSTHDAGGCLAGRTPSDRFGLKWLRADLPLAPGYVVTIEPGIYFINALIEDGEVRRKYREAINWQRVDDMRAFGGIRIEDDVLVTEDGADVLTAALPSALEDIEGLRERALAGPREGAR